VTYSIIQGDCLIELPKMQANIIDSCVTDPPYHLTSIVKRFGSETAAPAKGNGAYIRVSKGFMGKIWDGGDVAFRSETWEQVLRVLKPGAHLLAFGGTRGFHRLVCAIEDAGFEIRDTIGWLYGSGFPKSLDVSKAIDRAAAAEREVITTGDPVKRMIPGADQNVDEWIKDNGREFTPNISEAATDDAKRWSGFGTGLKPAMELICVARKPLSEKTVAANVLKHGVGGINIDACRIPGAFKSGWSKSGSKASKNIAMSGANYARWPANVCHDGSEEVLQAFDAAGPLSSGTGAIKKATAAGYQANAYGKESRAAGTCMISHGDSGSAARFFYTSKADAADRADSKHPTVKPVDLMRWLIRLVTPPGGTVLDPFCGTGSTLLAADQLQFNAIGIEADETYATDAQRKFERDAGLFANPP
jgi:DNA modification methylase